jgi:hypothetical protein
MNFEENIVLFNTELTSDSNKFNEVFSTAKKFVNELTNKKNQSVSYYNDTRKAFKPSIDILTGKMGEFFAGLFMTQYYSYPELLPDFNIYDSRQKNWDADLPYSKKFGNSFSDFHVKTCDSRTINFVGDLSWTFNIGNVYGKSFGRDKIYNNGGTIIFVQLKDYYSNWAKIMFSAPFENIHHILKNPIKQSLIGVKQCLYLNDILKENNIRKCVEFK